MRVSSKRLGICLNTMQSACKDLRQYSKGVSAAGRKEVDDILTRLEYAAHIVKELELHSKIQKEETRK
jgi:hypothetical protein